MTDYTDLAEQAYARWEDRAQAAEKASRTPPESPFKVIADVVAQVAREEALAPVRGLYQSVLAEADTDVDRYDDPAAMAEYLLAARRP